MRKVPHIILKSNNDEVIEIIACGGEVKEKDVETWLKVYNADYAIVEDRYYK